MPKRSFARFFVHLLQFGAVIYFFLNVVIVIVGFAFGGINISGFISVIVFTVILYALGILLDVALSIEQAIYELLAALKRPRN